ncbi:MAG: hypothetical protein WAK55_08055 [Xanthobacteraceae bacterium]
MAYSLEFLARALGVTVEHAANVEFLAPGGKLNNDGSGWQLQRRRRRLSTCGRAFVESSKCKPLAVRKFACDGPPLDWALNWQYDQGRDRVAIGIRTKLDALKSRNYLGAFREVFGKLDRNDHFAGGSAFHFQLAFNCCTQACVAAWPAGINSAMVNDNDRAV